MIESANTIVNGTVLEADICIIGAGAAGISMAMELMGRGLQVILLESGKLTQDSASQTLYEGEVADENLHSPPGKYRQRRFGGSTSIWGGRCMPFDAIDFEARSYIPNSGWPITLDDVVPFYQKASEYLETGVCDFDARSALPADAQPMIKNFNSIDIRTHGLERFSRPTRMGKRYRTALQDAKGVRVITEANCTSLRLRTDASQVDHLYVCTLAGKWFQVRTASYVLATGGLEVARLLLASNDVAKDGVGNANDVVGRYYMCHIAGNVGTLRVKGALTNVHHGYEVSPDGIYCRRRIQLSERAQGVLGVGNMVARVHFAKISDPAHRSGVLSGLFLAKNFISYEYAKRLKDGDGTSWKIYLQHLWNMVSDPLDTAAFLLHWLTKRTLADRKFPSVVLRNKSNRFSLDVHAEQAPRSDSRVTLIKTKDALGMPRIYVDWRYSKEDIETVRLTLRKLAAELKISGVAEFEFDEESLEEDLLRFGAYGGHHLGTARMGSDPLTSVVDRNCKVHGMSNLYIASAAVFATSSQANPTFTVVALAVRLAQHLRGQHQQVPQHQAHSAST
jgi:choline dehydrogenase-like flavoprotein